MYDTIVIGAGPAGITAGIYAKRGNLETLIIHNCESALQKATKIENYYGFIDGITGDKLYYNGIRQAEKLGIDVKNEEVIKIEFCADGFKVVTNIKTHLSKSIILATGTKKNVPKIKGIKEFEGKGISYCAICDGFFYKDKNVAVVGSGNYSIHEAETLKLIANSVTILTNGQKMIENRGSSDFEINEAPIREFRGDNVIKEVEFNNNSTKKIDGVFIAIGTASSIDLAKKVGALTKGNNIVTNENMQTTVRKLYACGDCTGGLLQVNKAVYEGATAALDIIKELNLNN